MKRKCPAKINLFLEVQGRRDDGYHEIETLMRKVSLFDQLIITPSEQDEMIVTGRDDVPAGSENTVNRALTELDHRFDLPSPLRVELQKNIPPGSGLGGGSSDAASAILMVNELFELGLSRDELMDLGKRVGSDVNFFLDGPSAVCTGRGEQIHPVEKLPPLEVLLILPGIVCETRNVYKRTEKFLNSPVKAVNLDLLQTDRNGPAWTEEFLFNRLQAPAFDLYPQLEELYRRINTETRLKPVLSGSGSTIFVVDTDPERMDREQEKLMNSLKGEEKYELDFQRVKTL